MRVASAPARRERPQPLAECDALGGYSLASHVRSHPLHAPRLLARIGVTARRTRPMSSRSAHHRVRSTLSAGIFAAIAAATALAQDPAASAPRPVINAPDNPLLRGFRWPSIGPVVQRGRL